MYIPRLYSLLLVQYVIMLMLPCTKTLNLKFSALELFCKYLNMFEVRNICFGAQRFLRMLRRRPLVHNPSEYLLKHARYLSSLVF